MLRCRPEPPRLPQPSPCSMQLREKMLCFKKAFESHTGPNVIKATKQMLLGRFISGHFG